MSRSMTRAGVFFTDSDTEFGIFYPRHYLLSAFSTLEEAEHARTVLSNSGWGEKDVISMSGEEVVHFAEEHLVKDGLWGLLMAELSRVIGTEAVYADKDLAAAKKGAAFVAVHCPTVGAKCKAWRVLEPTHPLVARYYSFEGIEHLAGET